MIALLSYLRATACAAREAFYRGLDARKGHDATDHTVPWLPPGPF